MKLNPYSAVVKKSAAKVAAARQAQKAAILAKKRGVRHRKSCQFTRASLTNILFTFKTDRSCLVHPATKQQGLWNHGINKF